MVFAFVRNLPTHLMCATLLLWSAGAAAEATPREPRDATAVQEEVDALRTRLGISVAVSAAIVDVNPLLVSVEKSTDAANSFRLSFERGFLAGLDGDELRAVIAHELGHVWIFTHHPYLQTERQANDVAMRVVSREILQKVYAKVWERGGTKGDLERFLGQ